MVIGPALLDDVLEGDEVARPGGKLHAELLEVQVILERFLEIMGSKEVNEVERLGSLRELAQLYDPVRVLLELFPQERFKEFTFLNARYRGGKFLDLPAERLEGLVVEYSRLALDAELDFGLVDREHGLLHGRIGGSPPGKYRPRHQSALIIVKGGDCPSGTEERPVGKGTGEPHPVQDILGGSVFLF